MGNGPSAFNAEEMKRLGKRFRKLDTNDSGTLCLKELMSIPEIKKNILAKRVFEVFDQDGSGEVDFEEFVRGMSQFSVQGDKISKLKFAFKIYDLDNDGFITKEELFSVLKMMVGKNLKEVQLQQLVDRTIVYADGNGDTRISFEEFCVIVGQSNVHETMVVKV